METPAQPEHPLSKLAVIIQDMIEHRCSPGQIRNVVLERCDKAMKAIHQNQNQDKKRTPISGGEGVSNRGAGR